MTVFHFSRWWIQIHVSGIRISCSFQLSVWLLLYQDSSSFFRSNFEVVNELETIWNWPIYKVLDLIFIFFRNRPSPKMFKTWTKMTFFIGVHIQLLSAASIWNLPLKIRIHHRVIWIHSSHFISVYILLIWIRILSIWIRILTLELRF